MIVSIVDRTRICLDWLAEATIAVINIGFIAALSFVLGAGVRFIVEVHW
jgi:hypothetical protein